MFLPTLWLNLTVYTEQANCRKQDVLLNVLANIMLPQALMLKPSGGIEVGLNMDHIWTIGEVQVRVYTPEISTGVRLLAALGVNY